MRFMTVEEAAVLCRCHPNTIRNWIRWHRLRSYKPGQRVLIKRSELEKFIHRGASPTSDDYKPKKTKAGSLSR